MGRFWLAAKSEDQSERRELSKFQNDTGFSCIILWKGSDVVRESQQKGTLKTG